MNIYRQVICLIALSMLFSFTSLNEVSIKEKSLEELPFAHLGLVTLEIKGSQNNFSTDIYFNTNASVGLDLGYDASLIGGVAPPFSIYTLLVEDNVGTPMGIQSLGENDLGNVSVPIGINTAETQEIELSIKEMTIPESILIYLEDKRTGIRTLLNDISYTFTSDSTMSNGERFLVHFESELLTTENFESSLLDIRYNTNEKQIEIKGTVDEKTRISIHTISGNKIKFKNLIYNNLYSIIDVSTLSKGLYIVSVEKEQQQRSLKLLIN